MALHRRLLHLAGQPAKPRPIPLKTGLFAHDDPAVFGRTHLKLDYAQHIVDRHAQMRMKLRGVQKALVGHILNRSMFYVVTGAPETKYRIVERDFDKWARTGFWYIDVLPSDLENAIWYSPEKDRQKLSELYAEEDAWDRRRDFLT